MRREGRTVEDFDGPILRNFRIVADAGIVRIVKDR